MAIDYGTGVSRTLDSADRQFDLAVMLAGVPINDSLFNIAQQIGLHRFQQHIRNLVPSGVFLDPTRAMEDYQFNKLWSNLFKLGNPESGQTQPIVWANVNGWIIPVAGTDNANGPENWVKLYPPPESDTRVDLVFLEAWEAAVQPNPATANKPSASTLWKYGNVKFGGTNLTDDIEDPETGFETDRRIQVQHRIRVYGGGGGLGQGIALDVYPDGLDDPNVLGQGVAASPVAGMTFANMAKTLGDASLWRAGDGNPNNNLGTVDGYVYAIPLCAVFRRNSASYVAVNAAGNPNQNGAFNRNPGAQVQVNPLTKSRELLQATLSADLGPTTTGVITLTNLNGSGLEDGSLTLASTFLKIGDEIIGISAVDVNNNQFTIPAGGRGRYGSAAVGHASGAKVEFFNTRPDGYFADEIASHDVLDLRRGINPGDWDYHRLLEHNVEQLISGKLRTAWKQSAPGDTEGPVIHEVDYLHANGAQNNPNHTEALDGPDGIRTIWSDASVIQSDVTILLDNEATVDADGNSIGLATANQFDTTSTWDVGPDFKPVGFLNKGSNGPASTFNNGSSIFMFIGGADGNSGARGTFRAGGTKEVRFVTPREYWKTGYPNVAASNGNQHPVTLRFINARAHEPAPEHSPVPARHPGPMYPWREQNFEKPFIVLGGLLHSGLRIVNRNRAHLSLTNGVFEIDTGIDWSVANAYFKKDANGDFINDPAQVTNPLLRGERTLFSMMTDNGRDMTGESSEVYIVVYGDEASHNNNGAYKVIGIGTTGITTQVAASNSKIVVRPLSADVTQFDTSGADTFTMEFRSQYHNAEDTSDYPTRVADLAIVLTDVGGFTDDLHPWSKNKVGQGEAYDLSFYPVDGNTGKVHVNSKLLVSLSLLYHPNRGAFARVAENVARVALKGSQSSYLRKNKALIDTTFAAAAGTPSDEIHYDPAHIQLWNRLPALGWHAPLAPNYGGNVVGFTEADRENELLVDKGSKTVLFRPFRDREMTLQAMSFDADFAAGKCLLGGYSYPNSVPKDGLQLLTGATTTTAKEMGFAVPREFMPRFGRQDIPYYKDTESGQGDFLPGINHLFTDSSNLTEPVFTIIGGESNTSGGNQVKPIFFVTNTAADYGKSGTTIGAVNNVPNYDARKTTDIVAAAGADEKAIVDALAAVDSSDLGRGLKGIQLPPYIGIARLWGVYDERDFIAKGGRTFKSNRYEVEDDPAPNLLREDADRQTLFILKDGARDLTEELDDHTYIIPSNVLDLTRAINWQSGDTFEDYDYVVVATVFVFSKGWINKNNYVLPRRYNGAGTEITDGTDPQLEQIHMCLPCPAGHNHAAFAAYNRPVYQGDPYMSRGGTTRTVSDYENRYGRLSVSDLHQLRTAVQQFDPSGAFVIETPNKRTFEVLASLDFFTTMGTGKIGGKLLPGTVLDVCHPDPALGVAKKMPATANVQPWRLLTRAFSEGQKTNDSRATLGMEILHNVNMNPAAADHAKIRVHLLDGTVLDLYGSTSTHQAALVGTGVPAADIFTVDDSSSAKHFTIAPTIGWGTLTGGTPVTKTQDSGAQALTVTGAKIGDEVIITPRASHAGLGGGVTFQAWVHAADSVTVRAHYPLTPFLDVDSAGSGMVKDVAINFGSIPIGSASTSNVVFTGAIVTDAVALSHDLPDGFVAHAWVSAANTITIKVQNVFAAPDDPPSSTFEMALFRRAAPTYALGDQVMDIRVIQTAGTARKTAENLATLVNGHAKLDRTIKAYAVGDDMVEFEAVPTGAEGNDIKIALSLTDEVGYNVQDVMRLVSPGNNYRPVGAKVTSSNLLGGKDKKVNAGDGTSQMVLTGMTERLPLGALLQDADFLCENPLGDKASAMSSSFANLRPIQTMLPLTKQGQEFTRFFGAPGELITMADGAIATGNLNWTAYTTATPGGTKKFRLFRGGGSAFVLSGDNPGGPIDWVSETWPAAITPVLKGGVLACRALLVRNFREEAFAPAVKTSDGDEIQMVVITHALFGDGKTVENGVTLDGIVSPTGYGEGYAAADRYRIQGRPMFKGRGRKVPDSAAVTLAVYPETERGT